MSAPAYAVGQRWWFVPSANRRTAPYWVTVTKVGRKWVTIDGDKHWRSMRVAIGSRDVDGGEYASPGSLYASQEEHAEETALQKTWRAFCVAVDRTPYHAPPAATIENIREAAKLIGIEVKP